jgi:hypothetical protein
MRANDVFLPRSIRETDEERRVRFYTRGLNKTLATPSRQHVTRLAIQRALARYRETLRPEERPERFPNRFPVPPGSRAPPASMSGTRSPSSTHVSALESMRRHAMPQAGLGA